MALKTTLTRKPSAKPSGPSRGDIWLAALNPVRGREQAGLRPVLIVSVDQLNHSALELVIIAPLTSRAKGFPSHVLVSPPQGGVKVSSWVKSEDLRSISTQRLVGCWGRITPATMKAIEQRFRLLLGL